MVIPEWYNSSDSLRAAYLYTEGVKVAAESENPTSLLPYLNRVLELDSLHGPAHHKLSQALVDKNPELAYTHSTMALRSDSTNIDYLAQHAYTQVVTGRYKAAQLSFNRLVKEEPHNPYNYHMAAALYAAAGMPHMAISILDSAEYKLGRIKELAEQKRRLLIGAKLYDRAINETLAAAGNDPFDNDNFRILGELYSMTGRDSLAMANFERALSLAPENPKTLWSLGDHYLSKGNSGEYLAVLQRIFLLDEVPLQEKLVPYDKMVANTDFYRSNFFAINTLSHILHVKYPNDFQATSRYATHLIRAGEIDKALQLYKQEARKEGAPLEAHLYVVDIEGYLGLRDSVAVHLDKAIESHPDEVYLYLRKSTEIQRVGGRNAEREIVRLHKKALAVAKTEEIKSSVCGSLGDYYYSAGRPNDSFRWFAKALEHNPENEVVLNNWAYFLCEQPKANLHNALEMSTKACTIAPTNPTYLDTQAWILHLMGRNGEAKTLMRKAISLDTSGDDTLLFHYAEILAAEGERFVAEMYYQKAIEAGGDKELIGKRLEALKQK